MSRGGSRRSGRPLPDVYVFRYAHRPTITLDSDDNAEIETQWTRLKAFFDQWFKTPDGRFVAAFENYQSADDFAARLDDCLRQWLAKRGFVAQGPVWDRIVDGSPFPGGCVRGEPAGGVLRPRIGDPADDRAAARGRCSTLAPLSAMSDGTAKRIICTRLRSADRAGRLASLVPDIVAAILNGRQLTANALMSIRGCRLNGRRNGPSSGFAQRASPPETEASIADALDPA
jgi:hypothetical protein